MANVPLRPSKAPNLPIAPVDYDQQYIDQLSNALRLYFAQVDNAIQELILANPVPFEIQVSQGRVPGYSMVMIAGENPDVDSAAYEDIWTQGGLTVYPAAALQMKVSSSSANDTGAGTGARSVIIQGLDANYDPITETVALTGQTEVTTSASFLRINKMIVATAGTGLANAGTIYIGTGVVTAGVPATIYNTIAPGFNDSLNFSYTIPNGYTGYIMWSRVTTGQDTGTTGVTARLLNTPASGIPVVTAIADNNNGQVQFQPPIPVRMESKTRITAQAIGAANNNRVGALAQLMLVQDGY